MKASGVFFGGRVFPWSAFRPKKTPDPLGATLLSERESLCGLAVSCSGLVTTTGYRHSFFRDEPCKFRAPCFSLAPITVEASSFAPIREAFMKNESTESRSLHFEIESLESRHMLAGTVVASISNAGNLTINGDSADNYIFVEFNDNGEVVVTGNEGTTVDDANGGAVATRWS